jgi:hypothetical protein
MSIYATLWEMRIRKGHGFDDEWVEVYAQAVPPHIGQPSDYPKGDPYADFLPPVIANYDPETDTPKTYRAVVIVQQGRDKKDIQRYVDPLIVMTGEEYLRTPFHELMDRIEKAVGWDQDVLGCFYDPTGEKKIIRVPGWLDSEEREAKKD